MGVIDKRGQLQRQNVNYYKVNPVFLTPKYEWKTLENKLYLTTMYKDYRIIGDAIFTKNIIDNTYHGTQNINDGVIIQNNLYGFLCVFTTKNGIYYTDPRVKYKDIKKPFKTDNEEDLEKLENIGTWRRENAASNNDDQKEN